MKVLVVDDASVMRKILIRELTGMGVLPEDISEASDGREAVSLTKTTSFDLILMDWNMPVMLGIDAVKEIRAAKIATPIVMVTTEAEKANVIHAIESGANNYLIKPFTKEGFQEKTIKFLEPALSSHQDNIPVIETNISSEVVFPDIAWNNVTGLIREKA